ncbi:carbohydrate sulfotransferase 1-like [Macrobrachium nipponense]|uniref:carbohydrate sulfotransferase 1-like n=1 Tax=Macrobrachium nipponense TaxID=159736 RepID=UPI0030C7F50B
MPRKWRLLIFPLLCFGGFALIKSARDTNRIVTSFVNSVTRKYVTAARESESDNNGTYHYDVNQNASNYSPGEVVLLPETSQEPGDAQAENHPGDTHNGTEKLQNHSWEVHKTGTNGSLGRGRAKPASILKPKAILLLSSVGRSGSSFLGELLASQGGNIYLYEPVRALPRAVQEKQTILNALKRNFNCQIPPNFLNIGKSPYVSVKHPYVLNKGKGSLSVDEVRSVCLQEPLRIIKTIRTRLQWTKELLEDESLDMKVIHLVRDPRGSLTSMDELEWNVTTQDICHRIEDDLQQRAEMERLYPDRYHFIKYEDFCLDSFEKTQELFRFLKGKGTKPAQGTKTRGKNDLPSPKPATATRDSYPDIPSSVFEYLKSHIHVDFFSRRSPWATKRDTSSHYQKWRYRITRRELSEVEFYCRDVIETLGHRLFQSQGVARNMSVPLFV